MFYKILTICSINTEDPLWELTGGQKTFKLDTDETNDDIKNTFLTLKKGDKITIYYSLVKSEDRHITRFIKKIILPQPCYQNLIVSSTITGTKLWTVFGNYDGIVHAFSLNSQETNEHIKSIFTSLKKGDNIKIIYFNKNRIKNIIPAPKDIGYKDLIVNSISTEFNIWRIYGNYDKYTYIFYMKPNETSEHIKNIFTSLEKGDEIKIIYTKIKIKGYIYKFVKNIWTPIVIPKNITETNIRKRKGHRLSE
jgi:hypothetical protein